MMYSTAVAKLSLTYLKYGFASTDEHGSNRGSHVGMKGHACAAQHIYRSPGGHVQHMGHVDHSLERASGSRADLGRAQATAKGERQSPRTGEGLPIPRPSLPFTDMYGWVYRYLVRTHQR